MFPGRWTADSSGMQQPTVDGAPQQLGRARVAHVSLRGRSGRFVMLVSGLLILLGLAASSVAATRAAARTSAEQHLADQESVLSGAARTIAPPSTPQAVEQMGRSLASIVGVTATSSLADLATAMPQLAVFARGGVSGIYDPSTRGSLAESPGWTDDLQQGVRATCPRALRTGIVYSPVIQTPDGPYTIQCWAVRGWGSQTPRLLALAGRLDGVQVHPAAEFVHSGTLMIIDENGVVASATDNATLGKRLTWWAGQADGTGMVESAPRMTIDGVDTQLIIRRLPGTAYWLVLRDPVASFYGVSRDSGRDTELTIVLLATIAGVLLILSGYRQFRAARRSESRLSALLEDTGDVVLVVRDGVIVFACGGWLLGNSDEITGRRPGEVFGGALAHATAVGVGPGAKGRFDTGVHLNEHNQRWVEVTVANRYHDPAVRGLVISLHDVSERREMQQQLQFEATHDHLTGLVNRGQFSELAGQVLARHRREGGATAVIYIDLDRFKPVNDRHGHEAGDTVLTVVSDRLRGCVREHDAVARLGGDEFALLLDGATLEEVDAIATRIRTAVAEPIQLTSGELVRIGLSLGTSFAISGDSDPETLIREADLGMFGEKASRRQALDVPTTREPLEHDRAHRNAARLTREGSRRPSPSTWRVGLP